MPDTVRREGVDRNRLRNPGFHLHGPLGHDCPIRRLAILAKRLNCGGETMTIYLMQGTDDATRVDEIEGKLKSTIPDLKRVPSLEDIDEISINGVERSIVVLVAAAPEIGGVENLIEFVSRHPRNIFFIVIGGDISARDYKRLIQSGNADWVAEAGSRRKFSKLSGASARPRETITRLNHRSLSRLFRAQGESAIPRSRSKPPSILSGTSRRQTQRSRSWISISSPATSATTSTSRPSFNSTRSSLRQGVWTTSC